VFITIACGAISGFHSLVSTGTTSKMIDKESGHSTDRLRRHAHEVRRRRGGAHHRCALHPGRLTSPSNTPPEGVRAASAFPSSTFRTSRHRSARIVTGRTGRRVSRSPSAWRRFSARCPDALG
jgi:hypothetical protein